MRPLLNGAYVAWWETHRFSSNKKKNTDVLPPLAVESIRFLFSEGITPTSNKKVTWSKVSTNLGNYWDADVSKLNLGDAISSAMPTSGTAIIIADTVTDHVGPQLFNGNTTITEIKDNCFNNITIAASMFSNCTQLSKIGTNCFNSVTLAESMFYWCTNLESVGSNSFASVTSSVNMFGYCANLTSVGDNCFGLVESTTNMFRNCVKLTSIGTTDFSSILNADYMFSGCSSIECIDIKCPSITSASCLFAYCSSLNFTDEQFKQFVDSLPAKISGNIIEMFVQNDSLSCNIAPLIQKYNDTSVLHTRALQGDTLITYDDGVNKYTYDELKDNASYTKWVA